jgi:hypothetical protein
MCIRKDIKALKDYDVRLEEEAKELNLHKRI